MAHSHMRRIRDLLYGILDNTLTLSWTVCERLEPHSTRANVHQAFDPERQGALAHVGQIGVQSEGRRDRWIPSLYR